jgi:hypothetical protein
MKHITLFSHHFDLAAPVARPITRVPADVIVASTTCTTTHLLPLLLLVVAVNVRAALVRPGGVGVGAVRAPVQLKVVVEVCEQQA